MRIVERVLGLAIVIVALAAAASVAAARQAVVITGGAGVVTAGHAAFLDASVHARWCQIEVVQRRHRSIGRPQRVPGASVRVEWTVPRRARSGTYAIGLRCAGTMHALGRARATYLHLLVVGGHGTGLAISVGRARLARRRRAPSERLSLTDALPPGQGNPVDYSVSLPPGVGGGGFATYWPLAQGARAQITEGPGGSYSHYTVYTHDAVDLGIPTGTELRAGFTGVVARVNVGCSVGDGRCGAGYGNYLYLKAPDGTCAVLAHMSRIDVSPGHQIAQYQLLGLSGNTGDSSGPHVHYDRVDCNNNRSMPWAPIEGGSLAEGVTITSQNHPPDAGSPPPADNTPPPSQSNPAPPGNAGPPPTRAETPGGPTHTWTNYTNAGGTEGPTIPAYQTVQIACKLQGFRVADGNTWWYRIASTPWNGTFYASADAFYNNGQTSGSLHGTPFVDPVVPDC